MVARRLSPKTTDIIALSGLASIMVGSWVLFGWPAALIELGAALLVVAWGLT